MRENLTGHITVLMATYNGEKYLPAMVESIIGQDYDDWDLVISDDGSTDDTAKVIDDFVKTYPDKIKRFVSGHKFGGACRHFLFLLENAQCDEYIMFCDQDDVWHRDKMRLTLKKMKETENGDVIPVLVHTDLRVTDENMQELSSSFDKYSALGSSNASFPRLIVQNVVTGCTTMINQCLRELTLSCTIPENVIMHDWWLALSAAAFGRIGYVSEATMDYRQHMENSVGAKKVYSLPYIMRRIRGGNIHRDIMNALAQAGELYRAYGDAFPEDKRGICIFCGKAEKMGKLPRLMGYKKYRLYPHGFLRRVKMMVWG